MEAADFLLTLETSFFVWAGVFVFVCVFLVFLFLFNIDVSLFVQRFINSFFFNAANNCLCLLLVGFCLPFCCVVVGLFCVVKLFCL